MNSFIPLSVPNFSGNEKEYVIRAIEDEWVSTAGQYISQFEQNIASYLNVPKAVACQSGTAGIHLSLISAGIGQGDEVIVPTLTFIATVNPVKYIGAEPVFMDCDDHLCIDPYKLKAFCENECIFQDNILYNKKTKAPIKSVIIVHVFGNLADVEIIYNICQEYNLILIEDATEALGSFYESGRYSGKYAGTIGRLGIYSFNGNKIITTGGGGMVVGDLDLLERIDFLSKQAKTDEVNFIHDEIGYNYRMTNLQAALGVAQLEQLEKFIEIKKNNYHIYKEEFKDEYVSLLDFKENIRPNYWFYSLFLNDSSQLTKEHVIRYLKEHNIQARPIWGLIHEQKPYLNNQSYKIEKASYYFKRVISIPCSSNLSEKDVKTVTSIIKQLLYSVTNEFSIK